MSEIKSKKDSYRQILSETDSILNSKKQPQNMTETIFKKDEDIVLVQINDTYDNYVTDYYINNEKLIYVETKNNDNSIDKTYYHVSLGTIVAMYKDGKEVEYTKEEKLKAEIAIQAEIKKLLKKYKRK